MKLFGHLMTSLLLNPHCEMLLPDMHVSAAITDTMKSIHDGTKTQYDTLKD